MIAVWCHRKQWHVFQSVIMYLISCKKAHSWYHKTCLANHCQSYSQHPCSHVFQCQWADLFLCKLLSIYGIHSDTSTFQHMHKYSHKMQQHKCSIHISLCTTSVIVTARLLNDQCKYMRSFYWAVCSTDRACFFSFCSCLNFGCKETQIFYLQDLEFLL